MKRALFQCTYDAVVGTALAAEVEGLVVFDAVVDDAVGEHGLVGDAEDKDAEGEVLGGLGMGPHVYGMSVLFHA